MTPEQTERLQQVGFHLIDVMVPVLQEHDLEIWEILVVLGMTQIAIVEGLEGEEIGEGETDAHFTY